MPRELEFDNSCLSIPKSPRLGKDQGNDIEISSRFNGQVHSDAATSRQSKIVNHGIHGPDSSSSRMQKKLLSQEFGRYCTIVRCRPQNRRMVAMLFQWSAAWKWPQRSTCWEFQLGTYRCSDTILGRCHQHLELTKVEYFQNSQFLDPNWFYYIFTRESPPVPSGPTGLRGCFCKEQWNVLLDAMRNLVYTLLQGFSLLTYNPQVAILTRPRH